MRDLYHPLNSCGAQVNMRISDLSQFMQSLQEK